jgi:hypothetical protein
VQLLGFDSSEDFVSQGLHLGKELLSELGVLQLLQFLEISLLFCWSDHGEAVLFLEVVSYQLPDFVFLLDGI